MTTIGIDPGTRQSAICVFSEKGILHCSMFDNEITCGKVIELCDRYDPDKVFVEDIVSYGMPVGRDTFETVKYIGMLMVRLWDNRIEHELVERPVIKEHHCLNRLAKDKNVTAALVDRFDPMREFGKYGKGTKKKQGPFYGFSGYDMWSSCAIAVYGYDKVTGK